MATRPPNCGSLPNSAVVRIEKLSKGYKGRPALIDLSLIIERGEIFGLLGHNGAGKSTTFGCMLGHLYPDQGEVFIDGHSVQKHRSEAMQRVGAIFETPAFYEYMTGWQNLRFLVSLSRLEEDARLREVVELVGLTPRINDPVRNYSHGMRQRLALAQALLPRPEFIILDEPTEGLDPQGIHEMRDMIRRLRDEHGLTVMLSSHLLSEVEQLCDRVAILHQGRLVFCGVWQTPEQQWLLDLDDWGKAQPVFDRLEATVRPDRRIVLNGPAEMADVIAGLVGAGIRVREAALHKVTLENFYLEHIKP
ncbi:ABC transporter ATP-binding protein [soil metagenome]